MRDSDFRHLVTNHELHKIMNFIWISALYGEFFAVCVVVHHCWCASLSCLSEIFKYENVLTNMSSFKEGRRWMSGIFLCCESVDGELEYQRRGSLSPPLFFDIDGDLTDFRSESELTPLTVSPTSVNRPRTLHLFSPSACAHQ